MAEFILTERQNIVAIADAIRAKTGSTEPMTLTVMASTVSEISGGGSIDPNSITVGLGEDGKVYAFADGQLVGVGVDIKELTPAPDEPTVTFNLAPGFYFGEDEMDALDIYLDGDVERAASLLRTPWDELISSGTITVTDNQLIRSEFMDFGTLVIPNGITAIGGENRESLLESSITAIYIPKSVTYVEKLSYQLRTLVIEEGESLVHLSYHLVSPAENLTTVVLPKNVRLEGECFDNVTSLESVKFNGTMEEWEIACQGSVPFYMMGGGWVNVICTDGTLQVECMSE